jgi:hypothetical protein
MLLQPFARQQNIVWGRAVGGPRFSASIEPTRRGLLSSSTSYEGVPRRHINTIGTGLNPRIRDFLSSSPLSTMAFFSTLRKDLYAAAFEFVGTVFFLLLGFGGIQAVAYSSRQTVVSPVLQVFVISTCMGLSLLAAAWVFFGITGSLFNPDITLALWIVGNIGFLRFVLYCLAELTGAIAAAGLILALTPGPLASKCVFHLNPALVIS